MKSMFMLRRHRRCRVVFVNFIRPDVQKCWLDREICAPSAITSRQIDRPKNEFRSLFSLFFFLFSFWNFSVDSFSVLCDVSDNRREEKLNWRRKKQAELPRTSDDSSYLKNVKTKTNETNECAANEMQETKKKKYHRKDIKTHRWRALERTIEGSAEQRAKIEVKRTKKWK